MKMLRSLIVVAVCLVGVVASAQDLGNSPDLASRELARMQGTWNAVSYRFGGQGGPRKAIQDLKCVVKGNQVVHERRGQVENQYTFSVDPSEKPHHIDQTSSDGKTYHGIYLLTRNTLTICMPTDPGADRPRQFITRAGDGLVLRIYKKAQDESPGAAAPATPVH